MSIKTTKRIALGVITALVFAPIAAITPASAAAGPTILTASSVSGTIAAAANNTTATGTVTLNLVESGAAGWDTTAADEAITMRLITRFGATGQCYFEANADGSAKGAVVTGYSDELFASVANEPVVEADATARTLTVTLGEGTTDNNEIESVTVTGLSVRCTTSATVGKIYVEVISGSVDGAEVNATWTTAELLPQIVENNLRVNVSNSATTSNFPIQSLGGLASVVIGGRYVTVNSNASLTGVSANAGTDVFTSNGAHDLTTGDRVLVVTNAPAGAPTGAYFARVTGATTFTLHSTEARALANTNIVDVTADAINIVIDMSWVEFAPGNDGALNTTAAQGGRVFVSDAPHGLTNGDAIFITDVVSRDDIDTDGAGGDTDTGDATVNDALEDTFRYVEVLSSTSYRLHTTRDGALNRTDITTYLVDGDQEVLSMAYDKTYTYATATASGSTITSYGASSLLGTSESSTYLGTIGSISATFNTFVANTLLVTSVATKPVIVDGNAGTLTVATNSAGALADGTATTFTVTLTGGKFDIAPTITGAGCTLTADLVYPRDSVTVTSTGGTCAGFTVSGKYDISGLTAGGSLSAVVTVDNSTDPVSYTTALQTRNLITFAAATGAPATPVAMASGDVNAAGAVVTVTESNAGAFKTGHWVSICFADAAGNDLFDTTTKFVWATVTAGDLKLANNVTTTRATLTDNTGVTAYAGTANQCAQVRVYSASTAASKITFSAGTPTAAEATVPFSMSTGTANGVIRMGVIAGDAVAGGQLYSAFVLGTRSASNNFTVGAGASTSFQVPASGASVADVTIAEKAKGMFGVGTITLQLSNSLGVDNNISVFAATSGANAPVVTQTASSDISWTYTVIADRVTITIASQSTDAAASFKISNIKLNVADKNVSGLAVTDNDLFAVVSGAAVASNSYYLKMATVAPADVVVEPVAPELSITKNNGRIFLTGLCQADEGDIIVYVKTPGKAWNEMAKTLECFAGAFDGDRVAPKGSKLYRVKQEGTGLFSNQVLVRP